MLIHIQFIETLKRDLEGTQTGFNYAIESYNQNTLLSKHGIIRKSYD